MNDFQCKTRKNNKGAWLLIGIFFVYLVGNALSDGKYYPWPEFCLLVAIAVICAWFLTAVNRSGNELCGQNVADCQEIIRILKETGLVLDCTEKNIFWWVDKELMAIRPAIMISPAPSVWQRIPNMFKGFMQKRNKYNFRCLNKNGSFGKKLTGDDVFAETVDAAGFLHAIREVKHGN